MQSGARRESDAEPGPGREGIPDQTGATPRCRHCGELCLQVVSAPISTGATTEDYLFCCTGCVAAWHILQGRALPEFVAAEPADEDPELLAYDLPEIAAEYLQSRRSDSRRAGDDRADDDAGGLRLELDVRGIHCQSCVLVCERSLERLPEVERVAVDYETGRARVDFRASDDPGERPRDEADPTRTAPGQRFISRAIRQLRLVGYDGVPLKPGRKTEALREEGRGLLWKIVLSGFAAGNTMMLSIALWSGYFDGSLPAEYKRLFEWMQFVLTTPVFLYAARGFHRGWRGFFRTGIPGMNVLISAGISAAYFYSAFVFLRPILAGLNAGLEVGVELATGLTTIAATSEVYFDSVAMIVFLLLIGRYLEWRARLGQRERMESLLRPLPDYCFRLQPANANANSDSESPRTEMIPVNDLAPGDLVLLRAGDSVPADGVLTGAHSCDVDEAVLTGEARSVARTAGDRLLAGSRIILIGGKTDSFALLKISATPRDSSLGILSRMTDATGDRRSRIERGTGRLVPWFGFAVIAVAAASFTYFYGIAEAGLDQALLAAVSVLIVSCPCALALSVPTAAGAALFRGLREGVLFRDGRVLEEIDTIRNFCFDKTGTLTTGRPRVIASRIYSSDESFNDTLSQTLESIRLLESGTMHPIGLALLDFARRATPAADSEVDSDRDDAAQSAAEASPEDQRSDRVQTVAGRGLYLPEEELRLGSLAFLDLAAQRDRLQQELGAPEHATLVGLARGERLLAVFALSDMARPDARQTLDFLRERGAKVSILTGDQEQPALRLATELDVPATAVHASLLPAEKARHLRKMPGPVCMVGDGFNDAPALAAADLSVVHALSAPLSLEQAGIVLLNNRLSELSAAIRIAGSARRVMRANLAFSLLYNAIMIPLAAAGLLLPIWCALFMALSSLTVIGSSAIFRVGFRGPSEAS
ncbi:MAG: heavy metal translocating P-type ATPase [bacterium]|nr:heavy metal translocating P-type ATPase [bacterium]